MAGLIKYKKDKKTADRSEQLCSRCNRSFSAQFYDSRSMVGEIML